MESLFEKDGGTYRVESDYYVPNLAVPTEPEYHIGVWGRRRLEYLKNHRRVLYTNLLTSGKLNGHLRDIDQTANERLDVIARQMAAAQGVTERLKAQDQMLWVGMMNNIRACAGEVVRSELVYR